MKMSTLKLSDLRKLCKDFTPKGLEKVRDFLAINPGMDLIGEGHGGSIRAAINANNTEVLKVLLKYHRDSKIDIHDKDTDEYREALSQFKTVFDEILAEYYDVIREKYLFSNEVKQALEEGHYLPNEDDEQDFVPDLDTPGSPFDCAADDMLSEDALHNSTHKLPSGETHHFTEVY